MINILLKLFLSIVSTIINFFITPIFSLLQSIYNALGLSDIVSNITSFLTHIQYYIEFAISYTGFTSATINIICLLLIGIITVPILVSGYKIVAKWISILP